MVGETVVTVVGNLTDDPEVRTTPSGDAVTHFTVASTPRTFDRQSNEWRDADTLFLRCSVWRQMAEHVAQSLARGTRVIVQGRLHQRTYETKEGEKRTVIELEALEIGPSLRYAAATVSKIPRVGAPGGTLFDTAPSAPNDAPEAPGGDKSAPHNRNSPMFPF
ncbi:single-stranded DNA-binding protein [Streptomyces sp. NPDC085927]|uniref:single-stranded DNA-binding protein n=1 Tax=Streptomyces sp. NPDC085927 TaxID=3365738 RepID=UPI0037CF959E